MGREIEAAVKPNQTLLEWLRDDLRLRGSRGLRRRRVRLLHGVGRWPAGQFLPDVRDQRRMKRTFARSKVSAPGDELDPVQQAFLEHRRFSAATAPVA